MALGQNGIAFGLDASLPGATGVGVARVVKAGTGETFLIGQGANQFVGAGLGPRALVAPAASGMKFAAAGPAASAPMWMQSQVAQAQFLTQSIPKGTRMAF